MDVTWHKEESLNPNDCWNHALARILGKTYHELRGDFKAFIEEDGSLSVQFVYGLLNLNKFQGYKLRRKLKNVVKEFNKGIALIKPKGTKYFHIVFIEGGEIFSNNENETSFKEMLNDTVYRFYTKER
jgi:hypothetical protein